MKFQNRQIDSDKKWICSCLGLGVEWGGEGERRVLMGFFLG